MGAILRELRRQWRAKVWAAVRSLLPLVIGALLAGLESRAERRRRAARRPRGRIPQVPRRQG